MAENDTLYGVLCYLGPLVLIPLVLQTKSKFVKGHMNQGLMLLLVEVLAGALTSMLIFILVGSLLNLFALICSVVGIYKVLNNKKWKVPFLGATAAKWKI
ncbi:MAG: DUF4870 domain-containing protein [Candidatus Nanoarchaeia archaeon]